MTSLQYHVLNKLFDDIILNNIILRALFLIDLKILCKSLSEAYKDTMYWVTRLNSLSSVNFVIMASAKVFVLGTSSVYKMAALLQLNLSLIEWNMYTERKLKYLPKLYMYMYLYVRMHLYVRERDIAQR